MVFKITIEVDGREVEILERQVTGSLSDLKEQVHQLAQQGEQVMAQAALTEAAAEVRRPCCRGRPMENRGRAAVRPRCLSGEVRVHRTRYRCRTCRRELYPADALLKCGRHRLTRPLAKRACQLATLEHFTRLLQLLWDQHGVGWGTRSWSLWFTMWVARPRSVAGPLRHCRPHNRLPAGQPPKSTPQYVYVSVDGIMYCTNQAEPHPEDSTRSRLIWQQMRVGCIYWQDQSQRWHKCVLWGRESVEEFAASLFRLACDCGYQQARTKVFAADGNRLVARTLDKNWEAALGEQQQVREDYEQFRRTQPVQLTDEQRARVRELAEDIPALWDSPTTTPEDRQQIVRMLIERIELDIEGQSEQTDVAITWAGGFTSRHHLQRTVIGYSQLSNLDELLARIVELKNTGITLKQVADRMNREGYTSLRGVPFTGMILSRLLVNQGIHLPRGAMTPDSELLGDHEWWLCALAEHLDMPHTTLSHWLKRGWVTGRKLPGPRGRWILWADQAEVDRLRHLCDTRRRWSDCPYPADLTSPKAPQSC